MPGRGRASRRRPGPATRRPLSWGAVWARPMAIVRPLSVGAAGSIPVVPAPTAAAIRLRMALVTTRGLVSRTPVGASSCPSSVGPCPSGAGSGRPIVHAAPSAVAVGTAPAIRGRRSPSGSGTGRVRTVAAPRPPFRRPAAGPVPPSRPLGRGIARAVAAMGLTGPPRPSAP